MRVDVSWKKHFFYLLNKISNMAEFEEEVTDDVTDDVETSYEEYTDNDSPTYEDYVKVKERLAKAEKSLVDYKKKAKTNTSEWEIIRFLDKNPEYEWNETEIKNYLKKWLSLNEIKKLVEPDKTWENRQKTQTTSISAGESWWSQTKSSVAELEKLPQKEYERVMDLVDNWKAVIG